MEFLYRKIDVPNLELLQEQAMLLFPEDLYKSPRLYFPADQSAFFKISKLVELLNLYNLTHSETLFAFYAMSPFSRGTAHIDWGPHEYSMNIPLMNCDKTFTSFYSTAEDPVLVPARTTDHGANHAPHYSYNSIKLGLIDKFESNIPCVMHIKTPHDVINPQSKFRINLLIRNNNNETMSNILNGRG